jgi:hypothetical protein
MNTQKQNIFIEKDIKANRLSNIYEEMENANENENEHKIESPFSKKLKGKKQEVLLANTDTDMEQTTITIKPKRQYIKKAKPSIVVEEPAPLTEAEDFSDPPAEEEEVDAPSTTDSDEESDEEEEEEEDEEVALLKRLAELKEAKAKKEAQGNIAELRKTFCEQTEQQRQAILVKYHALNEEQLALQSKLFKINEGEFDEELIANHLNKNTKSAPKPKGEKVEKKIPTYEGKGKKAGTGDARKKDVANLNSGKIEKVKYAKKVGDKTWSLMFEGRKDGGLAVVKDNKGVYDIPVFKEVGGMIGVSIKTKQEYIDWVKSA